MTAILDCVEAKQSGTFLKTVDVYKSVLKVRT